MGSDMAGTNTWCEKWRGRTTTAAPSTCATWRVTRWDRDAVLAGLTVASGFRSRCSSSRARSTASAIGCPRDDAQEVTS